MSFRSCLLVVLLFLVAAAPFAATAQQAPPTAAAGAKAVSSHFLGAGQKLASKKGSKATPPKASTPIAGGYNRFVVIRCEGVS